MIGIVIPAHNEAENLGTTLASIVQAASHPHLAEEGVRVVVVLDACTDGSSSVVGRFDVDMLEVQAGNVGVARSAGAEYLIDKGARWLAFTDADTTVAPDWLVQQLALRADAVCGSVGIQDWGVHGIHAEALRLDFENTYTDRDGHRHIHGANLGVCARAYERAGGFQPLSCHEDVALVAALEKTGAHIAWSAAPRVLTSARTDARIRDGFGGAVSAALRKLAVDVAAPAGTETLASRLA